MSRRLRLAMQSLSIKYSWHTLGIPVRHINSRSIPSSALIPRKKSVSPVTLDISSSPISFIKKTPSKSTKKNKTTLSSTPVAAQAVKFRPGTKSVKLITERNSITMEIYREYNEMAFENMLPANLSVTWSKKLTSTAGITRMFSQARDSIKTAEIILSEKVLDDSIRLRSTLLHEMCHTAAWLIDGERKPPHGSCFWKWASICSANIPGMMVSTCHNYAIHKPYQFRCINCHQIYGRHSRRGIDVEKQCCGKCKGKLEYMGIFNSDGTAKTPRKIHVVNGF